MINCGRTNEDSLVGSSIREVINWAVGKVMGNERALVIMGESGSGKTTVLIAIMNRLRRLRIPVAYVNTYNELGLRSVKLIDCHNDLNARVLLIDDIDAAFTIPRMAQGFINKVLGFNGTVITTLTIPLLVGNDLEVLEPLIKFLHSAPRMIIEYHDDDLRLFAQRIGIKYVKPAMRTPGMLLRNFRKMSNGNSAIGDVLNDGNVVL
ncbi:ATP-binding protein [Vulcanisaeta sp. JCM 16161]|uniref:ATP-binding protein n=1 Tax=Vulcanisaeta sp. JCM 16161 TaxID=1295372 RepID=UPI001FB33848|nr:ATP-binding protein [Vulcanisaeta sp. JCM 16161]